MFADPAAGAATAVSLRGLNFSTCAALTSEAESLRDVPSAAAVPSLAFHSSAAVVTPGGGAVSLTGAAVDISDCSFSDSVCEVLRTFPLIRPPSPQTPPAAPAAGPRNLTPARPHARLYPAQFDGAAVAIRHTPAASLLRTAFLRNAATGPSARGGAILLWNVSAASVTSSQLVRPSRCFHTPVPCVSSGLLRGKGSAKPTRIYPPSSSLSQVENSALLDGGAVFLYAPQPNGSARCAMSQVSFARNSAGRNGGGVATLGSVAVDLQLVQIDSATAVGDGGCVAIGAGRGSLRVADSTLSRCRAGAQPTGSPSPDAAGPDAAATPATACADAGGGTVSPGAASPDGGALWLGRESSAQVVRTQISATSAAGTGGAAYVSPSAQLSISDGSEIRGCSAVRAGGAFALSGAGSALEFASSNATGNSAASGGFVAFLDVAAATSGGVLLRSATVSGSAAAAGSLYALVDAKTKFEARAECPDEVLFYSFHRAPLFASILGENALMVFCSLSLYLVLHACAQEPACEGACDISALPASSYGDRISSAPAFITVQAPPAPIRPGAEFAVFAMLSDAFGQSVREFNKVLVTLDCVTQYSPLAEVRAGQSPGELAAGECAQSSVLLGKILAVFSCVPGNGRIPPSPCPPERPLLPPSPFLA